MSDLVPIRRALLSVSDKTGLIEFARALVDEFHVELVSTGGTARHLREHGLTVTDVSEVTGFPEMMDGRIKTLHPKIHGGLLALRDKADHIASMTQHDIKPIDLVCINLYPFQQTVAKPNVAFDEAIENIDIGGPAMVRSAAKNHRFVLVVTSPDRYEKVLGDLREHDGSCCGKHRLKQAQRAFDHTANYDRAIANYLNMALTDRATVSSDQVSPPDVLDIRLVKLRDLRYGENPHQPAALYVDEFSRSIGPNVARATQLHGKDLSYTNLLDADAALACVAEFDAAAVCVVKHATPCGVAIAEHVRDAFERAYQCDPVAAFGGIVALNRTVDLATAHVIISGQRFLEVLVAPAFDEPALQLLKDRWKNLRILVPGAGSSEPELPQAGTPWSTGVPFLSMHKIVGGYLVQARDVAGRSESNWKCVTRREPTDAEMGELYLAWLACKHVKSNAIVIAKDFATVGIGGGQVDRVGAARIAIEKAGGRAKSAVAASDAFFPFPDAPKLLFTAGVTALIQPGGSVRDQETVASANEAGAAMIFTGERHFRH